MVVHHPLRRVALALVAAAALVGMAAAVIAGPSRGAAAMEASSRRRVGFGGWLVTGFSNVVLHNIETMQRYRPA